jgi:hypothetical protein
MRRKPVQAGRLFQRNEVAANPPCDIVLKATILKHLLVKEQKGANDQMHMFQGTLATEILKEAAYGGLTQNPRQRPVVPELCDSSRRDLRVRCEVSLRAAQATR